TKSCFRPAFVRPRTFLDQKKIASSSRKKHLRGRLAAHTGRARLDCLAAIPVAACVTNKSLIRSLLAAIGDLDIIFLVGDLDWLHRGALRRGILSTPRPLGSLVGLDCCI